MASLAFQCIVSVIFLTLVAHPVVEGGGGFVAPVCPENTNISVSKSQQVLNSAIYCFNASALCTDNDSELNYTAALSRVSDVLSQDDNCLMLLKTDFPEAKYCITVFATEIDTGQSDTTELCVIFNEAPTFGTTLNPDMINLNDLGGQPETIQIPVNTDPDGISEVVIGDLSPDLSNFSIADSTKAVITYTPDLASVVNVTQVNITIQVTDDGNPPLTSQAVFGVVLVNDEITCSNTPREIIVDIDTPADPLVSFNCQSSAGNTLEYQTEQFSGAEFNMSISSDGALTSGSPDQVGDYDIGVHVSSIYTIRRSFNLTLKAGKKPACTVHDNTIQVRKNDPDNTVYVNFTCITEGTDQNDINFDIKNSTQDDFFDVDSSSNIVDGKVQGEATISLDQVYNTAFPSLVTVTVSNIYGEITLDFPISIVNTPPVLTLNVTEESVLETAAVGHIVYTFTATDAESSSGLVFSVQDAGDVNATLPFSISSSGELTTTSSLSASVVSSFSLLITVTDPEGLSDSKNFMVQVTDINEAPQCNYTGGVVTVELEITANIYQSLFTLDCQDADVDSNNKQLTYTLEDVSSEFTDFFGFNDTNSRELLLLKSLAGVIVLNTPMTQFNITVSDQGAPPLSIVIQVTVNFVDKQPSCSESNLQYTLSEKSDDSSCFNLTHTCTDPTSGGLNFDLSDLPAGQGHKSLVTFFSLQTSGSSLLSFITFCISRSINGEPGIYKANMNVSNNFSSREVSLTFEVTDVNDPPVFNNLPAGQAITISETQAVSTTVINLNITDPDPGTNGALDFTFEVSDPVALGAGDFQLKDNGTIEVAQTLNATRQDIYTYTVTVTDGGGLSETVNLTINIEDVNEAPQCEIPANFTVNATAEPQFVIGRLVCWDSDLKSEFKVINYTIRPEPVLISIDATGEIKLDDTIPYDMDNLVYTVTVSNGGLADSSLPSINLTVTIVYNKDFPPVCNATSLTVDFLDTEPAGCGIGKVTCTSPVQRSPTYTITQTNLTENFEVQSEENANSLSLRICTKSGFKNDIGVYQVTTNVTNDLRNVPVTWKVNLTDVNEPPYFQNDSYYYDLSEHTPIGTTFAVFDSISDGNMDPNPFTWEGYLLIQGSDPDIKTNLFQIATVVDHGAYQWKANGTTVQTDNIPIVYFDKEFFVNGTLDVSLVYIITMQITDIQGLSTSVDFTINITDLNEAPTCNVTSLTFDLSLKTVAGTKLDTLYCFDGDYDEDKKQTLYTLDGTNKDLFSISSNGELRTISKLPRDQNTLEFKALAIDGGNSSLKHVVDVVVNVNRSVGVVCNPIKETPPVWVLHSCVNITLNCDDPVADETSTITYTEDGNYTAGFNKTGNSGTYRLCYTLTTSAAYMFDVTADNGLKPVKVNVLIEVAYLRSTPKFEQQNYEVNVSESAAIGQAQLTVQALTEGNFTGNISYSIIEQNPLTSSGFFDVDEFTGQIKPVKDLSELVKKRVFTLTLTVQATDDLSTLKSSVLVKLNIQEVNLSPQCQSVDDQNVDIDAIVGHSIVQLQCNDSNIQEHLNTLTYSLEDNFFSVDSDGLITIKSKLPLTTNTHVLRIKVGDGRLSVNVTVVIKMNMLLRPHLVITGINTNAANISWSFSRDDYNEIVKRFLLEYEANLTMLWMVIPNTKTETELTGLEPDIVLNMKLLAETNFGNVTSNFVASKTAEIPVLTKITIQYKDKNTSWDPDYNNPNSQKFKTYSAKAESNLFEALKTVQGLHGVKVIGLSSGSVLVDAVVAVNQTGNISDATKTFKDLVYLGNLGTVEVDGAVSSVHSGDKYAKINSIEVTPDQASALNEGLTVSISCPFRLVGQGLTPTVKWSRNDKEITDTSTRKFTREIMSLDNDVFGYIAKLSIKTVLKRDEGAYSCELNAKEADVLEKRSLLVNVLAKPMVDLQPLTIYVESQSKVELNCTAKSGADNPVQFKWFRDGKLISNPPVTQVTSLKQIFTISGALANTAYYCQVSNAAGSTSSETSNIFIIRSDIESCPATNDTYGTDWPSTPVGQTVKVSCPDQYEGTVTRECSSTGEWKRPNYSNCIRQTLTSLEEQLEALEDGVEETSTDEVIDQLENVTGSESMVSGDINLSIEIMERVVTASEKQTEVKPDFVEDFVNTANNMLRFEKEVWEDLEDEDDSNGVTSLMRSLDSVGQVASLKTPDSDNDQLSVITTSRLVLAYGKTSTEDIKFPSNNSNVPNWIRKSRNQVLLQKAAFVNNVPASGKMGYSVVYYTDIEKLIDDIDSESNQVQESNGRQKILNSKIVSFSLSPHIKTKLNPKIELTLQHTNGNFSDPVCSFLDFKPPFERRGRWSSEGCEVDKTSVNVTVCKCDHLTNFAILMSPGSVSGVHVQALSIISAVGCGLSILFLVITILIYSCLWRYVKSDRAIILINLCIALIIAYSIFLGGVTQTENKDVCTAISALLHYFFLVVFFLMLAEGVEVLVSVVYVFNTKSRLTWLLILSWGVPLIVVGVSLGVTKLEGYGNQEFCWLSLDNGLLWAFVAPALLVIVANLIIICIVLKTMFSTTAMMTKTTKEKGRAGLKAICVLLPLMGVTWVFGVFSVNKELVTFQYLFAIFNSLQGFFIFVFHCIVSRQVRDGMRNRRRRYRAKSFKTTGTESSSQLPASKLNSTSEYEKPVNDLDKKVASPFIEADRQVQQLANKLYPSRANMKDQPKSPKSPNVPVDLSDIKLQNGENKKNGTGTESWMFDGHVLLTEEPSIEDNDAATIGSAFTRAKTDAPPVPVNKNAWGEGKKSAPVHFSDYKLGEAPLKKAGQLPPLKTKPVITLVDHYDPPPPDILADSGIQGYRDQETRIRESRERLGQVYKSQDPLPLKQEKNKPRKSSFGKKVSSQSQKSKSSNGSAGRHGDPVDNQEEVETIHLYEQRDMPLYRGIPDEPRPNRPKTSGERKKRQQKYHYESPRVMVNSEEDLSRYGSRQPFGGIRTASNAGVPGLARPRHQQDVRWQNYQYQW